MNNLNFNQDGGFRMSTDILAAVQASYSLFNALGWIGGNKTIISGCEVTGSNVSDGVVFVNGEVFNFKGGNVGTNVIVKENVISYPFQNGSVKEVIHERYVGFGTSLPESTYLWADFKRLFQTKDIQTFKDDFETRITALENKPSEWPIGSVIRYDQPLVVLPPAGFVDHIPDEEQGRVWVSRSLSDPDFGLGSVGGEKTHTLNINEIPSHSHPYDEIANNTNGGVDIGVGYDGGNNRFHRRTPNTGNVGGGQSHNNLQPYIGVRFIKRVS